MEDHYCLHLVQFIYGRWRDGASVFCLHWKEREKYDCIAGKRGYCISMRESNLSLVSRPCHLSHNQFPSCWQGLFSFPLCVHSQSIPYFFCLCLSPVSPPFVTLSFYRQQYCICPETQAKKEMWWTSKSSSPDTSISGYARQMLAPGDGFFSVWYI